MLKKSIFIFLSATLAQSCSAKNHSQPLDLIVGEGAKTFFSSRYYEDQNLKNRDDFKNILSLEWFDSYDVKDKNGAIKSISNCKDFMVGKYSYSESIDSEYSTFSYYLMHCIAIDKIAISKPSKKSFLPKEIVSETSPEFLPKEFIPIYSRSDEETLKAMPASARWADGVKVTKTEDLGDNRIVFYQDEQNQILSELARADFNGDGIEDSLVYLRTTINGGSHESDKIITITAGEDGVIRTLDIYPDN